MDKQLHLEKPEMSLLIHTQIGITIMARMSNYILHRIIQVISYPCTNLRLIKFVKEAPLVGGGGGGGGNSSMP